MIRTAAEFHAWLRHTVQGSQEKVRNYECNQKTGREQLRNIFRINGRQEGSEAAASATERYY